MKIKRLVILISVFVFACKVESKKETFTHVKGQIFNLKDSTKIRVSYLDNSSKKIDSCFSKEGKFSFNFSEKNNGLYSLKIYDSIPIYFVFWFDNENISITGDSNDRDNIKVINSKKNDFLRKYRSVPKKYTTEIDKILREEKDGNLIENKLNEVEKLVQKDQINLLFKNPNFLFSINEIVRLKDNLSKKQLNDFYFLLNDGFRKSEEGVLIRKYIESNQILIGEKFIDFEAFDLNGEKVKLSNFKDKIILLDFMAFWCSWCHVQNKEVFTYLNKKYKDDISIITYSLDEDKITWEKSVKKDSYKWINISNLRGLKDPISYKYRVKNLPHSFLIDKKGIIVKEFIGYNRDSLIEKEIQNLLRE